jgi:predicted secreted protein
VVSDDCFSIAKKEVPVVAEGGFQREGVGGNLMEQVVWSPHDGAQVKRRDARSRKLAVVAHCLLNQNAKVEGLASYRGVFKPVLDVLCQAGVGLIQLPCPEMLHLGPNRPLGSDTVEEYDWPAYRACCLDEVRRFTAELLSWRRAGYSIVCLLGVEGSPSCSVSRVPRLVKGRRALRRGRGIFMDALGDAFIDAGLAIPFIGVPEEAGAGGLRESLREIRRACGGTPRVTSGGRLRRNPSGP